MTQNNLGSALQNQGIRTGGVHGTELLAQAVDAYRSALEVRTREQAAATVGHDPEQLSRCTKLGDWRSVALRGSLFF